VTHAYAWRRPATACALAVAICWSWGVREAAAQDGAASTAAQSELGVPGLVDIFSMVPGDLWRFLSPQSGVMVVAGGGAASVAHLWDDDLAGEVATSVQLNSAFEPGHTYGAFSFQVLVGIGAYGAGRAIGQSRLARFGGDVIRAQVLSQVWAQAIKFTVGRERPDGSDHYSFPSGHSASSFATAWIVQRHFGWKVGLPGWAVAVYVAAARVHDNRHYLSDVIVGGALGLASGRTIGLRPAGRAVALRPVLLPGGGFLGVTVHL
jgi:membrane-associated phospholipid phosphatase